MQYVLSYVEEVRRHGSIKWTMRQIGVYHRYSSAEDKSLWILLFNRPNSVAQKRLETMIENCSGFRHIHLTILSAHFENWRWYLNTLGNDLEIIVDIALTLDFMKPEHYTHGSALLSRLQHLQDKVLQASARLKATKTTLSTLKEVNDSSFAPASDKQNVESFGGEIKIYGTQVTFRFSDDTGIWLPSICAVLDLHRHHNTLNNTHGRRVVPLYKQSKESEAQEKRTRGEESRIVISSYAKAGELK